MARRAIKISAMSHEPHGERYHLKYQYLAGPGDGVSNRISTAGRPYLVCAAEHAFGVADGEGAAQGVFVTRRDVAAHVEIEKQSLKLETSSSQ